MSGGELVFARLLQRLPAAATSTGSCVHQNVGPWKQSLSGITCSFMVTVMRSAALLTSLVAILHSNFPVLLIVLSAADSHQGVRIL